MTESLNFLNQLLDLNPTAKKLRIKRMRTKQQLKLALVSQNIILIKSLKIRLNLITANQLKLRYHQLTLLKKFNVSQSKLNKTILQKKSSLFITQKKVEHPLYKIWNFPKNSLSPSYKILFLQNNLNIFWKNNIKGIFNFYKIKLFQSYVNPLLFNKCSLTLYQKGNSWFVLPKKEVFL
jgi:hypothetical protein